MSVLGLTGDAGTYFGKQGMLNYRKLQLLAGPALLLHNQNGKVMFTPHALAGVANTHSKFGEGNNTYTSSNTAFAAAIGTDIMMKVSQKKYAGIRIDYNPAFQPGGVISNFRLSAGIKL